MKQARSSSWLVVAAAILVANSAYLFLEGDAVLFYFANIVLHLLLGVALVVPFAIWWWRRRERIGILVGGALLFASAVAGVALAIVGNLTPMRPLLLAHIALAVAGLVVLLGATVGTVPRPGWMLAALGLAAAVVTTVVVEAARQRPDPDELFRNPAAPMTMPDEAMGGAEGPFFPSAVHTANGETVPASVYLGPESCGRVGCHPDLVEQWKGSAHHFSSFNNQWYRKSIEYMQSLAGVEASKWCGGCHDPAILQSGMMDTPIEEIVHTPEAQAGLTCTACHMISSIGSSMGNGDYEITIPPLHDLATSDNVWLQRAHDLMVRLDPEPHRRTFMKPFFRGRQSSEYCSTCHKVHLDVPVNAYRWIRGFNEYDNWQASGVSGYGARSFYYPAEPKGCVDCHMPLVDSADAGNDDGLIRSHRFAAANTALPVANRDDAQLEAVTTFLQANQVTVDIFAMSEARPVAADDDEDGSGFDAGLDLATHFAVGEEQGMAVGAGAGAGGSEPERIYAPLDRVGATVRRGESSRVDVVVRTRGVGHFFPGGTVDAYDCWLELRATDETGRTIFWSGKADEHSPVEPGAHFYRALMIDAKGNAITKRNAWTARSVVYVRLIPPGAADTVHFRLDVPEDAGDEITLEAKLNYRKFSWYNTHWAYAGVPDPNEKDASHGRDHDDRTFVFTGDMSKVSGEIKDVPTLPIVVMAEDRVTLRVLDSATELPPMEAPVDPLDRERWNDYGIGLFLQGDLKAARRAFSRVTELEPDYVDGWVNLGRVALAEGALEEAEEVLARARTLDDDLPRTRFFLGLLAKESGRYDEALEHLGAAAGSHPRDRVVRNQIARVHFLNRDYGAAVRELETVFQVDPEDLMGHYTAMLAYRGLGEIERADHHRKLYERFKADESSQILTGEYRRENPHDNNERQRIHEHTSVPPEELAVGLAAGEVAG